MINKFEEIKNRYLQGFITDVQLEKYFTLGILNQEEYNQVYGIRHPEIYDALEQRVTELEEENAILKSWLADLQVE